MQQVGGSIGVAVLRTVVFSVAGHGSVAERFQSFASAAQTSMLMAAGMDAIALVRTVMVPKFARPEVTGDLQKGSRWMIGAPGAVIR